jgi:alkanesulfonate monooxygenase SsuD/methylene tetrahydromethanopterin reductase-like flavin-dependent oxidoreductase (luciferase family)
MKQKLKFGARLSRVISTVSPDSENPYITPYERIYWPLVREVAQECEHLGFDSVIMPDHPMDDVSRLACWSTLAALASCTKRVTLGTLTTNTMRYLPNPSLFIKEIATLDQISDGRLYPLGLGLGWTPHEYKAFGFPFPAHKIRLAQLQETIEMMNLMFTEDVVTYRGKYFQIEDLVCVPKPIQNPFPIVIGARGKRTLRVAAKYADHIDVYGGMVLDDLQDRLSFIEGTCTEYGRDYNEIVKSWGCWFWIYENEKELNRYSAEIQRLAHLPEGSPVVIKGTPEEIVEIFEPLIDLGISYFTLRFEDFPSKRGLRLFAEHVIPELK